MASLQPRGTRASTPTPEHSRVPPIKLLRLRRCPRLSFEHVPAPRASACRCEVLGDFYSRRCRSASARTFHPLDVAIPDHSQLHGSVGIGLHARRQDMQLRDDHVPDLDRTATAKRTSASNWGRMESRPFRDLPARRLVDAPVNCDQLDCEIAIEAEPDWRYDRSSSTWCPWPMPTVQTESGMRLARVLGTPAGSVRANEDPSRRCCRVTGTASRSSLQSL